MSEKARFINKPRKPRRRLWVFLALTFILVITAGVAAFFVFSKLKTPPEEKKLKIADTNLAAVLCRDTECYWLNRSGVAFAKGGEPSGGIILAIVDKTARPITEGEEVVKPEVLAELLFIKSRMLGDLNIGTKKIETTDPKLEDFDFLTARNWILRLSTAENAYKNLDILRRVLAEIGSGESALDYIDMRVPNKVYYKNR